MGTFLKRLQQTGQPGQPLPADHALYGVLVKRAFSRQQGKEWRICIPTASLPQASLWQIDVRCSVCRRSRGGGVAGWHPGLLPAARAGLAAGQERLPAPRPCCAGFRYVYSSQKGFEAVSCTHCRSQPVVAYRLPFRLRKMDVTASTTLSSAQISASSSINRHSCALARFTGGLLQAAERPAAVASFHSEGCKSQPESSAAGAPADSPRPGARAKPVMLMSAFLLSTSGGSCCCHRISARELLHHTRPLRHPVLSRRKPPARFFSCCITRRHQALRAARPGVLGCAVRAAAGGAAARRPAPAGRHAAAWQSCGRCRWRVSGAAAKP